MPVARPLRCRRGHGVALRRPGHRARRRGPDALRTRSRSCETAAPRRHRIDAAKNGVPMTKTEVIAVPAPPRRLPIVRVLAGAVALVALLALGRAAGGYLPRFAAWVDGLGAWGPVVFII